MMANEAWRSTFSGCRVLHELATTSDHKFLILKLLQDRVMIRRPFRFEIMWAQHDGCQEQIRDAFHKELQGSPSFVLCKKLQNCKQNLRWWNKHVFGDVEHKLDCVLQRLSEMQRLIENHNAADDLFRVENELMMEHNDILVQKANHWGQKACLDWFQYGEQNTRFYHNIVSCRRQRNHIHSIKDTNGAILTERR
ncbi:hypothetical protein IFM89_010553 [Coptis chinensis]|uniref:Uncharacterized protein n=1 Tax=Coptis chinensis TaxID=261450 RepID=A0A835IPH1_9MAGN|nr:hypothetical protein IFM89_010553 [Coptis chinensis]